ncbi:hypothetical protein KTJ32_17850 [Acinetobacter gyllenbergii]|uniref:hypothetical protein n=1 Tax=Acinetobacter gyllenbergii TaxID=134534 RepID=UPI0021CE017B|nr:hypothetical protein [Acinetobacter gyllenbergii]MCU4582862.1 hypothetical protein [Acinetobacter gyllenbergii]
MIRFIPILFGVALFSGCANFNSIHRSFNLNSNKSQLIDARQRAILVGERAIYAQTKEGEYSEIKNKVACAEPSPDVMAAYAAEFAAKGGSAAKASGELSAAMQDSAAFVGMRTPSIQLLRDYSYRLCEAYLSNAISTKSYESLLKRYQKNIVTLYTIEQLTIPFNVPTVALVSQSSAQTDSLLIELQMKRKTLNDEIKNLDQKILDENTKGESKDQNTINQLKSSKEQKSIELIEIEERINSIKGLSVSGKVTFDTKAKNDRPELSDEKFSTVVTAIKDLTINTLVDQDFIDICSDVLQGNMYTSSDDKELKVNCVRYLNVVIENAIDKKISSINRVENPNLLR